MNKDSRRIPNLIIPGFPKSGTSSLNDYLGQHPSIFCCPFRKESHIYTFNDRFDDRDNPLEYLSFPNLYAEYSNEKYIVDASTTYLISEMALTRIQMESPDSKIIIIARDPIERIISHYNWIRACGIKTKGFREEISEWGNKKFSPEISYKGNFKNYLEFSLYGTQIENCYKLFSNDQVLVLPFEGMRGDINLFMNKVFSFLEIEPMELDWTPKNITKDKLIVKGKLPSFLSKFEMLIPSPFKETLKDIINDKFLSKKIVTKSISEKDKKWLFHYLKPELDKMKKMNLLFEEWNTTNKFFENNESS